MATVVALGVVWSRRDPTFVVPPATETSSAPALAAAAPAAAAATLLDLREALRRRDETAAASLAPSGDDDAQELLRQIVRNARSLDLRSLDLRYVDQVGAATPGGWVAAVDVSWRFAGFDRSAADSEVAVEFAPRPDGTVAIAGFGGSDLRSPLWLTDALTVYRSDRVLVAVATAHELSRYVALAVTARRQVAATIPVDDRSLVVEVPSDEAQLDAALDADPGTYAGIAAVTAPVDGSQRANAPVHIFVNPNEFDRLKRAGAQVVMTHETTHALTDATISRAPLWLVEGFADWVALQHVDLPISTTAREIISAVRADGLPRALPGTADFDVSARDLDAVYESAWIACTVAAEHAGGRALIDLYHRSSAGLPFAATLRRTTGLSVPELTRLWRQRLSELAG